MSPTKPAKKGSDGEVPISAYVAGIDPAMRPLFTKLRKLVKELDPGADEKAYRGWGLYVRTDRGAVGLSAFREHVNVSVPATVRDPHGLLEGSGKQTRPVKVRTLEDAAGDGLRDLIRQGVAAGPPRLALDKGEGKRILERVRAICMALPDASERPSHGTPTFFARGKQFAQVWSGHHDDKGLQMWCAAPSGAQAALVRADPDRFFVPPYVGVRGWLGVRLDRTVDWGELEGIIQDAYGQVSPAYPAR